TDFVLFLRRSCCGKKQCRCGKQRDDFFHPDGSKPPFAESVRGKRKGFFFPVQFISQIVKYGNVPEDETPVLRTEMIRDGFSAFLLTESLFLIK
ncbi:MAG: hypothetical protein IKD50_08255, partial [Clostridia bacterium]|nr:hypothetical protein [Clostridia bacterium]